jgi:SAM-dependent methyltransferase
VDRSAYESFIKNERDHFWWIGRRAIFFDVLRRRVGPLGDDARVLDLGCGVGGMLEPLAEFGRVAGTDTDRASLRLCRERGFTRVLEAVGPALPFADGSVGLVTAFDVLEHIEAEAETLAECLRVLEPGGALFLSGPSYQILYTHQDAAVEHKRRYTVPGLERKLVAAGFEIEFASYVNCLLFPAILPVVLGKKLSEAISPPDPSDSRLNSEIALPRLANRLFARVFSFERHLLRRARLPFGHSLIAMARKPGRPRATRRDEAAA